MILSRVIEHVKTQNWTAVFIDFIIVVVGVFIGLQVNTWNEARKDARRGEDFAQRLVVDLQKDLGNRTQLAAYYDAVSDSAVRAIDLLNSAAPDPKELVVNAYRASEYVYDPQTRATWDEIVSSGDIGLLPREATGHLAEYYGVDIAEQIRQEIVVSRLRLRVRSTIPYKVQAAIRAGCSDARAANSRVVGFQAGCSVDAPEADIDAAANILKADPQLPGDLALQISSLVGSRANLRGDVYMIREAIGILQGDKTAEDTAP